MFDFFVRLMVIFDGIGVQVLEYRADPTAVTIDHRQIAPNLDADIFIGPCFLYKLDALVYQIVDCTGVVFEFVLPIREYCSKESSKSATRSVSRKMASKRRRPIGLVADVKIITQPLENHI